MNATINRISIHCSEAQKLLLAMGTLVLLWAFYFVIADTIAANHYVQIDQDIWQFLKYIGMILGGLAVWGLKELVSVFKNLVTSMNRLNETVALNNASVQQIKNDVSEINSTLKDHDNRIQKVEDKARRN